MIRFRYYRYWRIYFAILFVAILTSCSPFDFIKDIFNGKDDEDTSTDGFVPEVITNANFTETLQAIDTRLDKWFSLDFDNIDEAKAYVGELSSESWVEKVTTDDDVICISVKNGGKIIIGESSFVDDSANNNSRGSLLDIISMNVPDRIKATNTQKMQEFRKLSKCSNLQTVSDSIISIALLANNTNLASNSNNPFQSGSRASTALLEGCKNRKVLIANVTHGDENVKNIISDLDQMSEIFSLWYDLFDVDYRRGEDVSADFLRNNLTKYGLVFLIAHGYREGSRLYVKTGSVIGANPSSDLSNDLYEEWKNDNYTIIRDIKDTGKSYWGVGPEFFGKINGKFDANSVMVGIICNALRNNPNMSGHLLIKGLGAFIGFDNIVNVKTAGDALNSVLRLLFNPVNSKFFLDQTVDEVSLADAFAEYNKSPYKIGHYTTNMKLVSMNKDIALFSTISEENEVNLGLPSNYSSCNLGASSPENDGTYNEIFRQGGYLLSGYVSESQYNPVKSKLGNGWHMSTSIELAMLTSGKITHNYRYKNTIGLRVSGLSGESIFMPYSGCKINGDFLWKGNAVIYPNGDLCYAEEYEKSKSSWNKQGHNISFTTCANAKIYNLDNKAINIEINKFDNATILSHIYGYSCLIDEENYEVIYYDSTLNHTYQYVLRPAKRNTSNMYKEAWDNIDREIDKSLDRVKLATKNDFIEAAKYHYPKYAVKFK